MIVKSIPTGWEVIYQRAHGLLAAELAFHWKVAARPPHFVKTLLAIAEHDDGIPESRVPENLTPAGAPRHFQVVDQSKGKGVQQYRNIMEISTSKSRWNSLMTSLHMSFLYEAHRYEDADIKAFMQEQHTVQKKLFKDLSVSRQEAEKAYCFVEWCDALSLLLCMDQVQPEQRKMDISRGPDGTMYQLWQDKKDNLHVEPWPFEADTFEVGIEYRELAQLKFKDALELDEGLRGATVKAKNWTFLKDKTN
jgi:hypothetical protein